MYNNLIIQPHLHLLLTAKLNINPIVLPHMTIYDITADVLNGQNIDTLNIMPSANTIWIIGYSSCNDSRFTCIGCQSKLLEYKTGSYDNYYIVIFDDDTIYFNNTASTKLTGQSIFDRIIEYTPASDSPEYTLINSLLIHKGSSLDRKNAFFSYLNHSKRLYSLNPEVHNMRRLIITVKGDCTINDLSKQNGYSSRHINRLFNSTYGFSPKDFCKHIRFQKVLNEIITDPDRPNSEFIQNIGYSDQAHFQREFKSYVGMTPKQFINQLSQE